jgi:hypothetical protein
MGPGVMGAAMVWSTPLQAANAGRAGSKTIKTMSDALASSAAREASGTGFAADETNALRNPAAFLPTCAFRPKDSLLMDVLPC